MFYSKREKIPKPISEVLAKDFDIENMSTGSKRGMVLSIYAAKIRDVVGNKKFFNDLKSAELSNRNEADYGHPALRIYMEHGSLWRAELHQMRYSIKQAINERMESDFIREVKIR